MHTSLLHSQPCLAALHHPLHSRALTCNQRRSHKLLGGRITAWIDDQPCSGHKTAALCVETHDRGAACQRSVARHDPPNAVHSPDLVVARLAGVQRDSRACGFAGLVHVQAVGCAGAVGLDPVAVGCRAGLEGLSCLARDTCCKGKPLAAGDDTVEHLHTQATSLEGRGASRKSTC